MCVARQRGDADACRDPAVDRRHGYGRHPGTELLGHLHRPGGIGVGEQDQELLAAVASGEVALADVSASLLGFSPLNAGVAR